MNGLEYVTANLNIIFGFICAFAGFLVYQKIGNLGDNSKYIGLIGLGCGVIGFVLTLVYVIESGLIFTDLDINNPYGTGNVRIDSDGTFLEWDSDKNRYTCIFYKEGKEDSLYRRYSDYNNKYLNYYKDIIIDDHNNNYNMYHRGCSIYVLSFSPNIYQKCDDLSKKKDEDVRIPYHGNTYYYPSYWINKKRSYYENNYDRSRQQNKIGDCDKLYYPYNTSSHSTQNNDKKVTYDYWVTSLIFSCLIMVLYIGLALFGFLLFKDGGSDGSSGPVSIK